MGKTITIQSLIETHEQPFMVIDKTMHVVAINRAFERTFGKGHESLVGKPCSEVLCGQPERCHLNGGPCPDVAVFHNLQPYAMNRVYRSDNGHGHEVQVKGFPLSDADGTLYLGEIILPLPTTAGSGVHMVGKSPAFSALLMRLQRAAASDAPVLLQGETGTGKELAAAYIHQHSRRGAGPFVTVDCTVLGDALFESELFGHEKGAFTGAVGQKKGMFELADGGTLFLDEIGEMPLPMQAKLLRALETGTFRRVGSTRTLKADVRIVSATNRSLAEMVRARESRQDLYYRLAVVTIGLPPLRERQEDIPLLAEALLTRLGATMGQRYQLTPQARQFLLSHSYPGNIRELRNLLQLGAAMSNNGVIEVNDLLQGSFGDGWGDRWNADASSPRVSPPPRQMNSLMNPQPLWPGRISRRTTRASQTSGRSMFWRRVTSTIS